MQEQVYLSARGLVDQHGRHMDTAPMIPFVLDKCIDKDATIALHRAAARHHDQQIEDQFGFKPPPLPDDIIAQRATSYEREEKVNAEKEAWGAYLHEDEETLFRSRKYEVDPADMKDMRQIAKRLRKNYTRLSRSQRNVLKRGLDGGSGVGANLVGIDYSHEPFRQLRLIGNVNPRFPQIEVAPGYKQLTWPILDDAQTLLQGALTTNAFTVNTSVNPSANVVTFTPTKHQSVVFASGEFIEDALFPVVGALQTSCQRGSVIAQEHVLLNGDTTTTTTNINCYGSSASALGAQDPRLAAKGLRRLNWDGTMNGAKSAGALGGVNGSGSAIVLNNIEALLQALDKYAGDPGGVVCFIPLRLIKVLEQDTKARPDTYSGLVGYSNGTLMRVGNCDLVGVGGSTIVDTSTNGVPAYASWNTEGLPINLNANGVYDTLTKTQTTCVVCAPSNFAVCWKRYYQFVVVDLPLGDQKAVTQTYRYDFQQLYPNQGVTVGWGFPF